MEQDMENDQKPKPILRRNRSDTVRSQASKIRKSSLKMQSSVMSKHVKFEVSMKPGKIGNKTRNEYVCHLQNIRKAHKIIYRNLHEIIMFKANSLIDQKLMAMK